MKTINEVGQYFGKSVSGFVANKFIVEMSALGFGNLRFYVKKFSIPFENLIFVEDIYVSNSTLARPKNVLAVQSYYEVTFTVRMDKDNSIIKNLERLFKATHNNTTYETVAPNRASLFALAITVFGANGSPVYHKGFDNCMIVDMSSYDVDSSDRKLKDYDIKVLTNGIQGYSSTNSKVPLEGNVQVKCSEYRTRLEAARKAYSTEFNKLKRKSPIGDDMIISGENVVKALSVSHYFEVIREAKKACPNINERFQISNQIDRAGVPKIEAFAKEYGVETYLA